ncbi:MAG: hypothetical protein ACJ8FY_23915 [Gemmataceae bacterium]
MPQQSTTGVQRQQPAASMVLGPFVAQKPALLGEEKIAKADKATRARRDGAIADLPE